MRPDSLTLSLTHGPYPLLLSGHATSSVELQPPPPPGAQSKIGPK